MGDLIESWLAAHGTDLIAWRRAIHAYPELSRQEVRTTELVMTELQWPCLDEVG